MNKKQIYISILILTSIIIIVLYYSNLTKEEKKVTNAPFETENIEKQPRVSVHPTKDKESLGNTTSSWLFN